MAKLRVMTILGTRPEIIRLSRVMAALNRSADHVVVHTGQNYDFELNQVFFDDLELQKSEEFLIESGEGDRVVDIRSRYQSAIESTYIAVVERTTGRRVLSFSSSTKLDPNYALEVFRLAPTD